jgi:hypothetical protein
MADEHDLHIDHETRGKARVQTGNVVPVSEQRGTAGWFPDPHGRFEFRYYNGTQWTADVSVGGRRFVDQGGQVPFQHGWVPATESAPQGKAMALTAFIVGLVSLLIAWIPFLFVLGFIGAVVAFVFGVLGVRHAGRHDGLGRGFSVTGIVLSIAALLLCVVGFVFTRAVMREVGDFLDPGRYETSIDKCVTEGATAETTANAPVVMSRLVTMEGSITNKDTETHGYTITIDYLVDGVRSAGDTVTVDPVAPGDAGHFEATAFVSTAVPVECKVVEVFGPTPFDTPANP